MPLSESFLRVQELTRPRLMKLARRRKLIDTAFKLFQRKVYPDAQDHQITEMRICFFAGAAEYYAVLMYAMDSSSEIETEADLDFMAGVVEEIEAFHEKTVARAEMASRADDVH